MQDPQGRVRGHKPMRYAAAFTLGVLACIFVRHARKEIKTARDETRAWNMYRRLH